MFRSADRSPRRRNRAVTLIEAVLYIAIALALIVGGLVFYQQASTAAKTNTMVRQLSAVLAEGRVLVKGLPLGTEPVGFVHHIDDLLIAAGAVPSDMVASATSLTNPFGGTTEVTYLNMTDYGQVMRMTLTNVPQAVCARLLTASSGSDSLVGDDAFGSNNLGGTTLLGPGYLQGGAGNVGVVAQKPYMMNPTQAGWMCKYGSNNYPTKTVEPTSPPLSGNVTIRMQFLVNR
jgi:hypothetical protein